MLKAWTAEETASPCLQLPCDDFESLIWVFLRILFLRGTYSKPLSSLDQEMWDNFASCRGSAVHSSYLCQQRLRSKIYDSDDILTQHSAIGPVLPLIRQWLQICEDRGKQLDETGGFTASGIASRGEATVIAEEIKEFYMEMIEKGLQFLQSQRSLKHQKATLQEALTPEQAAVV
jgi:hypothetical protein